MYASWTASTGIMIAHDASASEWHTARLEWLRSFCYAALVRDALISLTTRRTQNLCNTDCGPVLKGDLRGRVLASQGDTGIATGVRQLLRAAQPSKRAGDT